MITPAHARMMARYNRWQNRSLYGAARALTDEQRNASRGAFFGSLHGTFCHLLVADQAWMHRLAGTPAPSVKTIAESATVITDWAALERARTRLDDVIVTWADALEPAWLVGDLTWSSTTLGRTVTNPKWLLVTHMFNHQTHHRGQAHCLLTQFGAKPQDTDIPFMPDGV